MLLKSSVIISHTKKLFKRSIKTFKSFLSNGYTKLPKSPPCHCTLNPFSCAPRISNMKFSQPQACKHQLQTENKETLTNDRSRTKSTPTAKQSQQGSKKAPAGSTNVTRFREQKNRSQGKDEQESRMILLSEKLREIEMMDGGNMEHVLDIEEVMHYYSRLTCPTYREIVDNLFAETYTEFLSLQAAKAATAADLGGINVLKRRVRQPRFIKV